MMGSSVRVTCLHGHRQICYTEKKESEAYTWKSLCLFSVVYTGACETPELISSSPFVWGQEENKSAFISLSLLTTWNCMKSMVVVKPHTQDSRIQKLKRFFHDAQVIQCVLGWEEGAETVPSYGVLEIGHNRSKELGQERCAKCRKYPVLDIWTAGVGITDLLMSK